MLETPTHADLSVEMAGHAWNEARLEYLRAVRAHLRTLWEVLRGEQESVMDDEKRNSLSTSDKREVETGDKEETSNKNSVGSLRVRQGSSCMTAKTLAYTVRNAEPSHARLSYGTPKAITSIHSPFSKRGLPRSSALRTVLESFDDAHGSSTVLLVEEREESILSSVALLIAESRRNTALVRFCFFYLLATTREHRALRLIANERFAFYRQRRIWNSWLSFCKAEKERRRALLGMAVLKWKRFTMIKRIIRSFKNGLKARAAARRVVEYRRLQPAMQRWFQRTASRLRMGTLLATADRFYAAYWDRRVLAGATERIRSSKNIVEAIRVRDHHRVKELVWIRWKTHAERRLLVGAANWLHYRQLLARCWGLWKHRQKTIASTTHHFDSLPLEEVKKASEEAPYASQAKSTLRVVQSRQPALMLGFGSHATAYPLMLVLRSRYASHQVDLTLKKRVWRHWEQRFQQRRADRWYIFLLRTKALKRWLGKLFVAREVAQLRLQSWERWRSRAAQRRAIHTADKVYCMHQQSELLKWWRYRAQLHRQERFAIAQRCLDRWKLRWFFRRRGVSRTSGPPTAVCAAFKRWKYRYERAHQHHTYVVLSDSIRDTVLLMFSFHRWWWRKKKRDRFHLKMRILADLREQRLLGECLWKWRKRLLYPRKDLL